MHGRVLHIVRSSESEPAHSPTAPQAALCRSAFGDDGLFHCPSGLSERSPVLQHVVAVLQHVVAVLLRCCEVVGPFHSLADGASRARAGGCE